jgi:hypothetical protein
MWSRVILVLVVACGGPSGGGGGGGGGPDAKVYRDSKPVDVGMYDFGCGGNTACTLDKVCCAMPSATTTFSCVTAASCAAADQVNCDGPDECGGATPVCCGVYAGDGTGNYPTCGIKTLGTSCTSGGACPTHLETTCSDTTKVWICHAKTDCTDNNYPECCTFTSNGAEITFCIDSFTAAAGGGVCH